MAKSPRNQVVALVTKHIDEFTDAQVKEILDFLQELMAEGEPKVSKTPMFNISMKPSARTADDDKVLTLDLSTYITAAHFYPSGNRTGATTNYPLGA